MDKVKGCHPLIILLTILILIVNYDGVQCREIAIRTTGTNEAAPEAPKEQTTPTTTHKDTLAVVGEQLDDESFDELPQKKYVAEENATEARDLKVKKFRRRQNKARRLGSDSGRARARAARGDKDKELSSGDVQGQLNERSAEKQANQTQDEAEDQLYDIGKIQPRLLFGILTITAQNGTITITRTPLTTATFVATTAPAASTYPNAYTYYTYPYYSYPAYNYPYGYYYR